MPVQRIKHPERLGDRLNEPDATAVSFVVLHDGWVEDLERLHRSLVAHASGDWEIVVVDNPATQEATERIAALDRVVHVPLAQKVGFGGGRNLGLRQARGAIAVVVDTSVELTGDVVAPLQNALGDEAVGLAGRWGISTADGFHFEDAPGPDVDGVEAYLMAVRRASLGAIGLFDSKFRWYRNADLDFSFRVRAAGLRTIVRADLPVVRHEHRLWNVTPEGERDEMSRKNFWRFRDHWGARTELFVGLSSSSADVDPD